MQWSYINVVHVVVLTCLLDAHLSDRSQSMDRTHRDWSYWRGQGGRGLCHNDLSPYISPHSCLQRQHWCCSWLQSFLYRPGEKGSRRMSSWTRTRFGWAHWSL
jgi:hypothetical protein